MNADAAKRLEIVRELASKWLPPRRRRDKRASLGLVLAVARMAGVHHADSLAEIEIEYLVGELLRRGRREDGGRVSEADLEAAGLARRAARP